MSERTRLKISERFPPVRIPFALPLRDHADEGRLYVRLSPKRAICREVNVSPDMAGSPKWIGMVA